LLVLVAALAGWSTLRAATWTAPVEQVVQAVESASRIVQAQTLRSPVSVMRTSAQTSLPAAPAPAFADPSGWTPAPLPQALVQPDAAAAPASAARRLQSAPKPGAAEAAADIAAGRVQPVSGRRAAGHALLQAAGYARLQVPPQLAAYFTGAAQPAPRSERTAAPAASLAQPARRSQQAQAARTSRWSGDGWLLWRDDTTTPVTSGRPSYGRSQMGAVVRYALSPQAGQRPQAYVRASSALQGARENGVAAGLSARPLARVPVRLAGEMRVNQRSSGTQTVAAAYAVTELAPQRLPGGLVAEVYGQAGYVGGRDATAFADGQARIDRTVTASDDFDLRAGAAVWGGAQDDGSRLDVGPSASLQFRVGDARGRVAADYRFRVAGDAEPASGPALTLSAGF
jgi:hypothetical protein